MKKKNKIILRALFIFVFILSIFINLWRMGVIVFDYAEVVALECVRWNGREYSPIGGIYSEGRTIARDKNDYLWEINMVKEDPSHTFIVARSFLDDALLVADDYNVPTYGKLTTVAWNGNYIKEPSFLQAVSEIKEAMTTTFVYMTDSIYGSNEKIKIRPLYFAYNDCPVTTNFKGYMGKVNGKWVATTYVPNGVYYGSSTGNSSIGCYEIPEEYWSILDKYFE